MSGNGARLAVAGLIFDLDGVMFRGTNNAYIECHRKALSSVGIALTTREESKLMSIWSHPHEAQLAALIPNPADLAKAVKIYEAELFSSTFDAMIDPIPGAAIAVHQLKSAGYRLGVATGMHPNMLESALGKAGIQLDCFDSWISGYALLPSQQKPSPHMLETVLKELSLSASAAGYIGDSEHDMHMAIAAGVRPFAVLTGLMTRQAAIGAGAVAVLDSVASLPSFMAAEVQ